MPDLKVVVLPGEETLQALGGEIRGNGVRIDTGASCFQGALVDVGGEHLDGAALTCGCALLQQKHGHRVRFLAGGAARHPYPHRAVRALAGNQRHYGQLSQFVKSLGVTEKGTDPDQHVLGELNHFLRVLTKQLEIVPHGGDLLEAHAPFDAADDRAPACSSDSRCWCGTAAA